MRLLQFAAIAAVAAVASSTPVAAGERIVWHDLDLNTPEGAQALHGRIDAAARRACAFSLRPERRIYDTHRCRAAFHAEAMELMPERPRTLYLASRTPTTANGSR